MITEPGIYDIPAVEYHADCCPAPSLSASIAHVLLSCSPLHARFRHPRLSPAYRRKEDERFDVGTAAHAYILEGERAFHIINATDYRTKAAKEERDAARRAGKVPLLVSKWSDVQAMAEAAANHLQAHQDRPRPLTNGYPEKTLVWREGEIWCKARIDWLHNDGRHIDDLKTTAGSANPEAWTRGPLFASGYDLQAGFYLRGLRALTGAEGVFRFVLVESTAPYALSVIGLTPAALVLAEKKVRHAIEAWTYCLAENRWPGYPLRTCYAELPAWMEAQWLEREVRDEARDDGRTLSNQLIEG